MLQNAFEDCMEQVVHGYFFFNQWGKGKLQNQNFLNGHLKTSKHEKMIFCPFENELSALYRI